MDKQNENETKKTIDSAGSPDGSLSEAELDAVSAGDESPKETITFEYGGLAIKYGQQNSNG